MKGLKENPMGIGHNALRQENPMGIGHNALQGKVFESAKTEPVTRTRSRIAQRIINPPNHGVTLIS